MFVQKYKVRAYLSLFIVIIMAGRRKIRDARIILITNCAHTHTHTHTYTISHTCIHVTHTHMHTHTHTHVYTHTHSILLGDGRESNSDLRELAAGLILSNPDKYSTAVLGKRNTQYVDWLLREQSWGGTYYYVGD